jgi:hypothetical protein
MRTIGLVLIALVFSLMSIKARDVQHLLIIIAGCALTILGFLSLTVTKRMPPWSETLALYLSLLVLFGLMLIDDRPMLPGILYFVLIPSTARMPRTHRIAAWLVTAAALACVYLVRRLYLSIDPIVPICQFVCIGCVAAFTEASCRHYEAMEENTKLLEGLIAAQRRAAANEAAGQGAVIRKNIGELIARAALQVEGTRELWPLDQNRAAQLLYKAQETMRAALSALREHPSIDESGAQGFPSRVILAHSNGGDGRVLIDNNRFQL